MGSNESLPPPVPSGEPPNVPPPPPAVPQFAPTEPVATTPPPPVTQPVPVTQAMPPVPPPPGAMQPAAAPPAGGGPPTGEPGPAGESSKQHLVPWVIGAAVLVVALVLVAVFALRGDDETSGSAETTAPVTSAPTTTIEPVTSVATSVAPTSAPATVAPTTPSTASTIAPTTSLPDAVVVADDTGVFTVLMLDTFELDSRPTDLNGVQVASVVGATDMAAFQSPDDHDTFGVGVMAGPSDQLPSVDDLLAAADPGPSVCADRSTKTDYPTQNGAAQVLLLDGCGTGGLSAKVYMVLTFPDRNLTMMVGSQGPGPSATDLFDFTQAVVESVVFL